MSTLTTFAGLWVYEPTPEQTRKTCEGQPGFVSQDRDRDGEKIYLVTERSVLCPNPEIGEGKVKDDRAERWFVSFSECKQCEFCRPRRRSLICQWED